MESGDKRKRWRNFIPVVLIWGFLKQFSGLLGGFSGLRFGEDIDMSIRIMEAGFGTCLLPEAYVYHKRRTSFRKFFKQVYNSGMARINLFRLHPQSLKLVHFLPACFVIGCLICLVTGFLLSLYCLIPVCLLGILFFVDSLRINRSVKVAFFTVLASFIQLSAYGIGFMHAVFLYGILRKHPQGMFIKIL